MTMAEAILLTVITASTPLLLAAIGELVAERSGVLNLGVEGMMAVGAACGFAGAVVFDSTAVGVLCGIAAGAVLAALFAVATGLGVQRTPHAWVFRTLVRPRLGPPAELEDAGPPRFAQAVGLAFSLVGLAGFLAGATLLGLVATGFALVAALLNAVFGLCLGCEMYLLIRRFAG